jgi:hypothetical protein
VERVRSVYISDANVGWSVLVPVWWVTNELPGYAWPPGNVNLPWLPATIVRRYVTLASLDRSVRYKFPIFNPWSAFLPTAGDSLALVGLDGVPRTWYVRGRVGEKIRGRP